MRILALESSCDEFAGAVVEDGRRVLSSVVASQVDLHGRYGGVVPELAGREHLRSLVPVLQATLEQAGQRWEGIDAVAVTQGPGLGGSLLVGINAAKALAWARGLPCLPVHHIEGHLYANWLEAALEAHGGEPPSFPLVCLVVSGGHTELLLMHGHGQFERLGQTLDDAAGEAFDKVGRLLGLPFPGGPAVERAAQEAVAGAAAAAGKALPRAWLAGSDNFSFSGIKTAVLNRVRDDLGGKLSAADVAALAYAFQESMVDVLSRKTADAALAQGAREVIVAGGVAANGALRRALAERCSVPLRVPPAALCTDNAAMIGGAAYYKAQGEIEEGNWDLFSTSGAAVFSAGGR
ncbi:MAG: tRNA (adenosine(37)-N6)-threonylcarbamoyltransferase complex transferase subunit TsaD [Chloroflexi bacterium]|nr:tRNA (adenosine(37)-N6)-threonylcarbamoyltransferase complex transferase subunit TsaD [Chloroflexota bacterium]